MKNKLNFRASDETLIKVFKKLYPYDLALLYAESDSAEKARLIYLLECEQLSDLFVELEIDGQIDLFYRLELAKQKELLDDLESDDLKGFIKDIDVLKRESILKLLTIVKRKTISLLLTYEDDLAASIMSTDFITILNDATIKEATNKIVTTSKDQDYIDTIFIIDKTDKMVGFIDLKQLITARGTQHLDNIMVKSFQFVYEDESIEKAVQKVKNYDRNSIPVLNSKNEIIGIVTADDIFDEIVESTEQDYQKMALLSDHESSSTAVKRVKQRMPWLMTTVILNLVMAGMLSFFEATLAQVAALALFQPLLLGMAGNIGIQSLAVTILGLHLEEFDSKKMPKKHIMKEVVIGGINSALIALAAFVLVTVFLTVIPVGDQTPKEIALVVFIAVFVSMFVSSIMGVLVPLSFNKMKIDPAAASGPIMTTINDVVALVTYFGVAALFLL